MSKDPAFLFYSSDFLTGVSGLTMEERGQYITLLCLQHQKGPLSEKTCRIALGLSNLDETPEVMEKFEVDEYGQYYNVRLDVEIQKRAKSTDASRENGQKGGRPKKPKQEPKQNLQVSSRLGKSKPKHNLSENENEDINKDENINKSVGNNVETTPRTREEILIDRFDEFWEAYPRKVKKSNARESWLKIKPSAEFHKKILAAVESAKKSTEWKSDGGKYIPHPTTWLNQKRWEDELTPDISKKKSADEILKEMHSEAKAREGAKEIELQ